MPTFTQLNDGWNADPNDPGPQVSYEGGGASLRFLLNGFAFPGTTEGDKGLLSFADCSRWRLGSTNDEGWYRGQCRYSKLAPSWGEFFELTGDDPDRLSPKDWQGSLLERAGDRHFLFYLRDNTFECLAADWSFSRADGAAK